MTELKVKYNKDTSWTIRSEDGKLSKKLWNKRDVEDFLDLHENLSRKRKLPKLFSKLFKFTR
tara:strand:+ start:612 stop:797 length:186 start_codon:yes stop_codon:yes gene_type:complete